MLSQGNEKLTYRTSDRFRLVEKENRFFLQHSETGARVETDELGKQIIESLPATLSQLKEIFRNPGRYISSQLLEYYILLFRRSGIVAFDLDEEQHIKSFSGVQGAVFQKSPLVVEDINSTVPLSGAGISVVIVTFNGEKFIRQNLESLYKQTLPPGEIIVVDNVSSDNTLDIVAREFKGVKVIRNRKNYHYARAVNIGVKAARGDLVIILNQDIVLKEDFVEMLYRRYDREESKEAAAGIVPQICFNKLRTFINGIGNFVTEKSWGSDNYFGVVDIGQFEELKYVSSACFGAIMVTKAGWEKVGPLDKKYKSFYEDADWSMRTHLQGMNLLAAPQAIAYHEFGGSYPSGIKLTFVAKNRMRFVLKHLKGKLLKKFFIKYLKQDIKNCLSFLRNRAFRNFYYYMKAYLRILGELPGVLLMRRKNIAKEETIREFFTKGAPYVVLSNKELNPLINKHAIRGYYCFTAEENFKFSTEPIVFGE